MARMETARRIDGEHRFLGVDQDAAPISGKIAQELEFNSWAQVEGYLASRGGS